MATQRTKDNWRSRAIVAEALLIYWKRRAREAERATFRARWLRFLARLSNG